MSVKQKNNKWYVVLLLSYWKGKFYIPVHGPFDTQQEAEGALNG